MGAAELLARSIAALARSDAAALEQLAQAALSAEVPSGEHERRVALAQHRALGQLLTLTRRNLRLLRGEYAGGYGAPRG
ncbi:MAG: hypothetical protein WBG54_09715 [Acidobacteriaceae bacterium]